VSNSDSYSVSSLIAEFLAAVDATVAFGIASVHNVAMLDAIGERGATRFVMSRGEMGAGHMADGYARASGSLGVVVTSTGPGAANAVPALLEARVAATPLLHLTAATATRFAGRGGGSVHDVPAQLTMLGAVCKSAYTIGKPQDAFAILVRAAVDALTPPMGPVSVEVPIDLQRAAVARPAALDAFQLPLPARPAPAAADVEELVRRVKSARRPLLWAGSGARHAGDAVRALMDLGFGLVTSWAGRGVVGEDHPMSLGALNGNGMQLIEDFYRTVDLMLVVGSRLRGHETVDFSVPLPSRRIQIDLDPVANGRTYPCEYFVCGDSRIALSSLAERLRNESFRADPQFGREFQELKARSREAYRNSLGPYAGFAERLRKVTPRNAIWARDITIAHSTWGTRLFEVYGRDSVYPVSAGIGQGLSLGIGASIGATGRKTVILSGDGGLAFNLGELWTAAQEKIDAVIIVMNDSGYGVIRHIQDATTGGRRRYCDLAGPELGKLAGLLGMPFWKAGSDAAFEQGVAEAMDVRGPSMVEVDMRAIGYAPRYYPYGPKVAWQ